MISKPWSWLTFRPSKLSDFQKSSCTLAIRHWRQTIAAWQRVVSSRNEKTCTLTKHPLWVPVPKNICPKLLWLEHDSRRSYNVAVTLKSKDDICVLSHHLPWEKPNAQHLSLKHLNVWICTDLHISTRHHLPLESNNLSFHCPLETLCLLTSRLSTTNLLVSTFDRHNPQL